MFALQWCTRFSPFAQNLISNFYFKPTRHLFHWKKRLCFTWAFLSSWSLHSSAVSRPYPGPKQIISNVHKYCMRSSARLVPANNKGMHTTFSWWNIDTWSGASSVGGAGRPGSHKLAGEPRSRQAASVGVDATWASPAFGQHWPVRHDNRLPCFTPDQAMASTLILYHILCTPAPGFGTPAYAQESCFRFPRARIDIKVAGTVGHSSRNEGTITYSIVF